MVQKEDEVILVSNFVKKINFDQMLNTIMFSKEKIVIRNKEIRSRTKCLITCMPISEIQQETIWMVWSIWGRCENTVTTD